MPIVQQIWEWGARLVVKGEPHGQAPEVQDSWGGSVGWDGVGVRKSLRASTHISLTRIPNLAKQNCLDWVFTIIETLEPSPCLYCFNEGNEDFFTCNQRDSITFNGLLVAISCPLFFWKASVVLRNTGVGCHVLLQGIFPTQEWNLYSYVFCIDRQVLYH